MGGTHDLRSVGRVYGADGAVHGIIGSSVGYSVLISLADTASLYKRPHKANILGTREPTLCMGGMTDIRGLSEWKKGKYDTIRSVIY